MGKPFTVCGNVYLYLYEAFVPFKVVGTYWKGTKGRDYTPNGDPGSPPEPSTVEIRSLFIEDSDIDILPFISELYVRRPRLATNGMGSFYYSSIIEEIEDAVLEDLETTDNMIRTQEDHDA